MKLHYLCLSDELALPTIARQLGITFTLIPWPKALMAIIYYQPGTHPPFTRSTVLTARLSGALVVNIQILSWDLMLRLDFNITQDTYLRVSLA